MYKSIDIQKIVEGCGNNKVLKYDLLRLISKQPESQEELNKRRVLSQLVYIISSVWRFNALKTIYVTNKAEQEVFPIIGNFQISEGLREYIEKKYSHFKKCNKIKIVDIGAAGGALTSLYTLKILYEHHLLQKVELHLVDVAEDALIACKKLKFEIPYAVLQQHGFKKNILLESILKKIKESTLYCCDVTALPDMLEESDIVVSGFTHHHLNLPAKEKACKNMLKIAKNGAFIGVADECLDIKQYVQWYNKHSCEINELGEKVPIAMESFIQMYDHLELFGPALSILGFKDKDYLHQPEHYTFWGIKNGK
jgi:hypothetical protein